MRPKLTWRVRRWSIGSWVEPVSDEFRKRYGDAAADTVELMRDMVRDHHDQPSAQDRKATLRALVDAPADADLSRLDTHTDALVLKHSWGMYRVQNIKALLPEQVAACAQAALAELPDTNGRPKTNGLAVMLVRDLLAQLPAGTTPSARDALLRDALQECGLGASVRTIKALHSLVRKSRARILRSTPPPASPWGAMLQTLNAPTRKSRKTRGRRAG